jgi:alkylation response protein AidB-like acyl-CoA dehydrogenase
MDFTFTSEQTQLADALGRYLTQQYDFESRKKAIASPTGFDPAVYAQLAELGVTALPMPEEADGFGGNACDLLLVMQELGKHIVVEPIISTLIAAEFVKRSTLQSRIETLKGVASGATRMACALGESQSRYELSDVLTTARQKGSGYVLSGMKPVVLHAQQSDLLVVSARISGQQRDQDGIGLFLVSANATGVHMRDYRTIDNLRAADVTLKDVEVDASAVISTAGWPSIDAVSDYGVTLLCAEAVGAMDKLLALTVEYTKTRKQFGQPIAKFQALQHRMVEMFMHVEQARSMAYLSAVKVDSSDVAERRRAVSAAKVRIGQAAKYVGQEAVQLHGGMGVTNEMPAAHYFKRLTMFEITLGDSDHHLERFIACPQTEASRVPLRQAA